MSELPESKRNDKFDRAIGALVGIPDVINTPPVTVRNVTPMTGTAQTFIVQTFRHRENGDTLFVEYVDDQGSARFVIPPKVTKVIARQRDALTTRSRKRASKASAEDRKARGIKPAFLKNRARTEKP